MDAFGWAMALLLLLVALGVCFREWLALELKWWLERRERKRAGEGSDRD
ncbi:MAG: hypothetical protein WA988_17440 [Candidatus Nanopelagicales bacterium]